MIKLNLPKFKQDDRPSCGPTALRMVLTYLGKNVSLEELYDIGGVKEDESFSTLDLGIVAKKLGFGVNYYTRQLNISQEDFELYSSITSESLERYREKIKEAKKLKVNCLEKRLNLTEILQKLDDGRSLISVVDWNRVEPNYSLTWAGHDIVLCGYSSRNIFFINPHDGNEHRMARRVYNSARKAKGTEEDLLEVFTPVSPTHKLHLTKSNT